MNLYIGIEFEQSIDIGILTQPKAERMAQFHFHGDRVARGGRGDSRDARATASPRPRSLLPQKISYFSFLKNTNTFTSAEICEKISTAL